MSPELDLGYVKEHQLMEIFISCSDRRCASPSSSSGTRLTGFKVLHLFKSAVRRICCCDRAGVGYCPTVGHGLLQEVPG